MHIPTRTSPRATLRGLAASAALVLVSAALVVITPFAAHADNEVDKISYCHANEGSKGYVAGIDTAVDTFFQAGHGDHEEDIVPPFHYLKQGEHTVFPGTNWDAAGQAIFAYGCEVPNPGIQAVPDQCTTPFGTTGGVTLNLSSLVPTFGYTVSVSPGGQPDQQFTASGTTAQLQFTGLPAPGSYEATVTNDENGDDTSVDFDLAACPRVAPGLKVLPTQCTEPFGDSSSVSIEVSGLFEGHDYHLSLRNAADEEIASADFPGPAATTVTFFGIPAPASYTVVVTDIGEDLSSTQGFTLDPCPTVVPTITLTPHECVVPGGETSTVDVLVENLLVGTEYTISVLDQEYTFTADAVTHETSFEVPAPGGPYTVTITDDDHADISASSEFSLEACPILEPEISIQATQCTVRGGDTGDIEVFLEELMVGTSYTVSIFDENMDPVPGIDSWTFTATETTASAPFTLPAGATYTVEVVDNDHADNDASSEVTLDPCPLLIPTITVTPAICLTVGGLTSSATLQFGMLTVGETYRVTVTDDQLQPIPGVDPVDMVAADTTGELLVESLPAPGNYRAEITWIPGGDVVDEAMTAAVLFALAACPAFVFELPTLALTGLVVTQWPLLLGLLFIIAGALSVLAIRSRRPAADK